MKKTVLALVIWIASIFVLTSLAEAMPRPIRAAEPSPCDWPVVPILRNNDFVPENGQNGKIAVPPNNADMGEGADGVGNVFFHNGEFFLNITDLDIPSKGLNFSFTRFYKNQISYNGPLGNNWDFNYNIHIVAQISGGTPTGNIYVVGFGRKDLYTKNPDDTFNSPNGIYKRLIKNADNSYTLQDSHGLKYNFYGFGNSVVFGALKSIEDRNANSMWFGYDSRGMLNQVTDTANRHIFFRYHIYGNNAGRLLSIVDFAGREIKFTYDEQGDLTEVRSPLVTGTPNGNDFPNGKVTKYTYSSGNTNEALNHNLLTITNPNETALEPDGAAVLTNVFGASGYNEDKVLTQYIGGNYLSYNYLALNPGADPNDLTIARNRTRVVDRAFNAAEYQHNILGNRIYLKEFTGRIDPEGPVFPPSGRLRDADPWYFETFYQYNVNSERTKIIYPLGNLKEFGFDASGNLLSIKFRPYEAATDEVSIITTYTYEANYNFVKTTTNPRGFTTTNYYDYEEASLGDLNGDGITSQSHGNIVRTDYPQLTLGVEAPPQIIQEKFVYDNNGLLLKKIQGEGNYDEFVYYSPSGYLWKSKVSSGSLNLITEYTYDSVGNVTSIKDPKGNITNYVFNSLNQVVKTTSPAPFSYEKLYYYDANNNSIQIDVQNKDKDNNIVATNPWITTNYAYSILDNLTSKTEEIGDGQTVTTQYQYDNNENFTRTIYPEANSDYTSYDERDLVYQTFNDANRTSTSNYDWNKNLKTYLDANNNTITCNYDLFDRLTQIIDALGQITTKIYDKASNITQEKFEGRLNQDALTNTRLSQTDYSFDEIDRQYQEDAAFFDLQTQANYDDGLRTTKYFYDRNSRLYKEIDDNNHTTQYQFDNANRLKKTINALNYQFENVFDNNSNIIQFLEQNTSGVTAYTTTYIYDNLNRLTQTTNNLGNSNFQYFDSRNNVVYTVDAKGNTKTYTYDGLNRLTQIQYDLREGGAGNGNIIDTITNSQSWDGNSRLATQTNDNSAVTTYNYYNDIDKLSSIQFADATAIFFNSYDPEGNLISYTDQNGNIFTDTYDALNRLIQRDIDWQGIPAQEIFGYGGKNLLTQAQDDDSLVTRTYDSLENLLTDIQNSRSIVSSFDSEGNRLQLTYPNGSRYIDYIYDGLDRLDQVYDGDDAYDYNYSFDFVASRNSIIAAMPDLACQYDAGKRIAQIDYTQTMYDVNLHYGNDQINNRLYEQRDYTPGQNKGDVYIYDSKYQLSTAKIEVNNAQAESQNPGSGGSIENIINYLLDGSGNRTSVVDYSGTTIFFTNPLNNEYYNIIFPGQGNDYSFDNNGNLTAISGNRYFTYDYRNQLIEVRDWSGVLIASYQYDALGRRISKNAGGQTINIYYDGRRRVQDRNAAGVVLADYVYGLAGNEILHMRRPPYTYYFHQNPSGSTMFLSYASPNPGGFPQGHIAEIYEYDPFGKPKFFSEFYNPLSYSYKNNQILAWGKEYDPETGMYYFGSGRYYYPEIGRFLQNNPSGIWANQSNLGNGYAINSNNPVATNNAWGTTGGQLGTSDTMPKNYNDFAAPEQKPPEQKPKEYTPTPIWGDWERYYNPPKKAENKQPEPKPEPQPQPQPKKEDNTVIPMQNKVLNDTETIPVKPLEKIPEKKQDKTSIGPAPKDLDLQYAKYLKAKIKECYDIFGPDKGRFAASKYLDEFNDLIKKKNKEIDKKAEEIKKLQEMKEQTEEMKRSMEELQHELKELEQMRMLDIKRIEIQAETESKIDRIRRKGK